MAGPLPTLRRVVDGWVAHVGQKAEGDATSRIFALLDRVFPKRWHALPWSHLSSDGSPIQLSVDTARLDELRMVIELSWLLAKERGDISVVAEALPADQARLLTELRQLVGAHVPRLGVGLRLRDSDVACKIYIGSDSPADFVPWIRSLSRNGLLPRDRDRRALRLCKHIAKSSIMRGCSFTADASGAALISSIYYRSLVPYRRMSAFEILWLADVVEGAPTALSVADALGFADGAGKGCFGHTVGIAADGRLDNLKVEFARIPWHNGHELSLESLRQLDVEGLASAEALRQIITEACDCDETVRPEVISWRGAADGPASIVTYFPLPRPDRPL